MHEDFLCGVFSFSSTVDDGWWPSTDVDGPLILNFDDTMLLVTNLAGIYTAQFIPIINHCLLRTFHNSVHALFISSDILSFALNLECVYKYNGAVKFTGFRTNHSLRKYSIFLVQFWSSNVCLKNTLWMYLSHTPCTVIPEIFNNTSPI